MMVALNLNLMPKAKTQKQSVPAVNIFTRMVRIWDPNFLAQTLYPEGEVAVGRTWRFWFFWNTILTILACAWLWWSVFTPGVKTLETELWPEVPAFEFVIEEGEFSTTLPEPYVLEDKESIFVIDTEETTYTEDILDSYEQGVFVNKHEFAGKKSNGEYQSFKFKDLETDLKLNRADVETFWNEGRSTLFVAGGMIVFLMLWGFMALFGLLTALWWALVAWVFGLIFGIKDWAFGKSYLSVLNLYFIPIIAEFLLMMVGIYIPFSTLIIFVLVFGLNFYFLKQHQS